MSTIALRLEPMSSIDTGVRDIALDVTGALEVSEVLSTITVTSSDTSSLTITNSAINASVLVKKNGNTVAIGKAVQMRLTTVSLVEDEVKVYVIINGDSGTKETYEIIVPLVSRKTY